MTTTTRHDRETARRHGRWLRARRADGGMDVEDCAKLSRECSALLDVADPIARAVDAIGLSGFGTLVGIWAS